MLFGVNASAKWETDGWLEKWAVGWLVVLFWGGREKDRDKATFPRGEDGWSHS